jgi:hypothetical protein
MSAFFDSEKGQKSAQSDPEGRPVPDKDRDVIALSETRQARHAEFLDALQRAVAATRNLHTPGEPPTAEPQPEPQQGHEPEPPADEVAMFAPRSARRPLERTAIERKVAERATAEHPRYDRSSERAPVERASFGRRPLERMPLDRAGAAPALRQDWLDAVPRRPDVTPAAPELPRALRPRSEEIASGPSLSDHSGTERMPRAQPFEFDMPRRRADALDRLKQHQLERALPPGVAAAPLSQQVRGRGWLASTARFGLVGVVVAAGAFAAMQFVAANSRASVAGQGLGAGLWSRMFGESETVVSRRPARLVLSELDGVANRPVALGVKVEAAPSGASLLVRGLPPGSRITAGSAAGATAWRVPVRELGQAAVMPPANFTGVMNLTVDLRRSDDSVADTDVLRVSWTPNAAETVVPKPVQTTTIGSGSMSAPPTAESEPPAANEVAPPAAQPTRTATTAIVRHLDREEIVNLLKRGQLALQNGDIAAARLLLRRAAEAGDAPAAVALAATFDPLVLRQLGVLGSNADVEKARSWYQRAAAMGSDEASQRLLQLAQQSR